LLYRGNTIDTTTIADIKVSFIKERGERKMSSIPRVVNNLTAVSDNMLFVSSALVGKFESKDMWKNATATDIYDLSNGYYMGSIYLYNGGKSKVSDFIIANKYLYAIAGNYLHRYDLNVERIKQEKITGRYQGGDRKPVKE
jgi:hypothetical protein